MVIGDFNFHFDKQDDSYANKLRDVLFSLNCNQHVHVPTHIHGHMLDLLITRSEEAVVQSIQSYAPDIFDHTPLTFSIQTWRPPPEKKLLSFRKIRDIDMDKFKSDIQASTLLSHPADDVNELVEQYNSVLTTIMDDHAPVITKYVTDRSGSPWYNEEIREAKRCRRHAERKWQKTRLTVHLDLLREQTARVNNLCRQAKSDYYKAKIEDCAGDQRSLFRLTNQLMHRQRNVRLPTHEDPNVLANDFVQFFVDKIENINKAFIADHDARQARHIPDVPQLPSFQAITEVDLKKLVISGNSKCCHLDPVPTTILKECIDFLTPVLTTIVNKSIVCSEFPQLFKFATLVPLLKKPSLDQDQFKNYRPVSNLAYVGKLIEKVVVDQLNDHRSDNHMHPDNQSAYRKNHSTETALVKIVNDLLCEMDQKRCVLLVLLDLSAAFDTVDHGILLRRLEEDFGVTGSALLWLESYFSGRTQAANINGTISVSQPLTTGMPQGSHIGPTEFPPYTSPIFEIAQRHDVNMHMYADDTQLYVPFDVKDYDLAVARLEACIAEVKGLA